MVKFTWEYLGALCAALMVHAERLNSLLEPSWPDAEKVHEEMYNLVDTLMIHAVEQKWFSTFAKIGRTEEMVTSQEIRAVSWGGLFCISAILLTKNSMSTLLQATGNGLISCIHVDHEKYESNAMDWQQVIEIGWHLLTRQDMERFKQMCEDGLLGGSNYIIFEDWSAIDRSRDGYLRIKDGLVLGGEVQEMEDEETFYDAEPYKARVHAFFLAYHQMRLSSVAFAQSDGLGALS